MIIWYMKVTISSCFLGKKKKKAGQNSERNKPKKMVTCNVLESLIFHIKAFVLFVFLFSAKEEHFQLRMNEPELSN